MADDMQHVRELLEARIEARFVEVTTELKAMARALALTEEFPTAIDKAIKELRELHEQRIDALEKLFDERFVSMGRLLEEQRRAETEARDKAEQSIRDQLLAIDRTFESRHDTTRTLIDALKERMTLITGGLSGAASVWGYVVGILGLIIAALAIGVRIPW